MICKSCIDGYNKVYKIHSYPNGPGISAEFDFVECEECHGYGYIDEKYEQVKPVYFVQLTMIAEVAKRFGRAERTGYWVLSDLNGR